jgi:hypothetical protein
MGAAMKGLQISEVAKIPWGPPPGIPEIFVEAPTGSQWTGEPARLERADVPVRRAPDGAFGLLAADSLTGSGQLSQVLRLTLDGSLSRLDLQSPMGTTLQWQILDFALDPDAHLYLLEKVSTLEGSTTYLRRIGPDGVEAWRRPDPWQVEPDLELEKWSVSQLLTGGGSTVYLSATRRRGLIARIDPDTGQLSRYADLGSWTGDALLGPDEHVYFVRFVPELNARAWVRLDPKTGEETQVLCSPEAFDLLALTIGVDAQGRAYGVRGRTIGCIGTNGDLLWRDSLDGDTPALQEAVGGDPELRLGPATSWQVAPNGTIYLSAVGSSGFHLLALEP